MNTWTTEVKYDEKTGDSFIEFDDEFIKLSGLKEGDVVKWVDNLDGSFTLLKTTMEGYITTDEYSNPEMNRKAVIFVAKDKSDHIIDMYENETLVHSRKIQNHRYSYVEDCAENWVFAYGEFKK